MYTERYSRIAFQLLVGLLFTASIIIISEGSPRSLRNPDDLDGLLHPSRKLAAHNGNHSGNHSSNHSRGHFTFLGKHFSIEKWKEVKEKVDCWATNGEWRFNNITIFDNWPLYNPCIMYFPYGPRNPCNWLLDRDVLKYKWTVSESCPQMMPFTTERLCRMMKGRGNIMIVGDSVNELFASQLVVDVSLSSNVSCLSHTRRKDIFARETIPCPDRSADDPLTLTIVRNDYLSIISKEIRVNNSIELSWEDALNPHEIGLLILNRGAHYKDDPVFIDELNTTMRYLHEHHSNVSIVWRNTPHGINFKESYFTPPLSSPPPIPHRYGWENFPRQNAMIYKYVAVTRNMFLTPSVVLTLSVCFWYCSSQVFSRGVSEGLASRCGPFRSAAAGCPLRWNPLLHPWSHSCLGRYTLQRARISWSPQKWILGGRSLQAQSHASFSPAASTVDSSSNILLSLCHRLGAVG